MKPPFSSTQLIVGIAWLATAAIAFSVGRILAPAQPGGSAPAAEPGASLLTGRPGPATGAETPQTASRPGQFSGDDGPLTLEKLTNGQPLDKWVKNLMAQEDSIVRMSGFMRLLDVLNDPADLRAAIEAMDVRGDRGPGRGFRFTELSMLLEKWAKIDPKGAVGFTEGSGREERWLGTSAVLRTWTRNDPAAAIAWAQANSKEAAPDAGGDSWGWRGQPPSAMAMVISQLARTDLTRALALATTETLDRQSRTMDVLASELVSQRGMDGARAAVDGMAAGSLRDNLVSQLAGRFAAKDAPGTAEWVLGMPAGEARARALAETVGEWAKADPKAVGNFLTKLPVTAEADRSRETFANAVVQKDPQTAIAWATSISDEQRRMRAVESLARTWLSQDAAAANAWLLQSTLSDETKARIQSAASSGGGFGRGRGRGGN